jgi:hypothetical protein
MYFSSYLGTYVVDAGPMLFDAPASYASQNATCQTGACLMHKKTRAKLAFAAGLLSICKILICQDRYPGSIFRDGPQ